MCHAITLVMKCSSDQKAPLHVSRRRQQYTLYSAIRSTLAFTCYCVGRLCVLCYPSLQCRVSCLLVCRRFAKYSLRYLEISASTPAQKLIVTTISGPSYTPSGCCSGNARRRRFFPLPPHGILHLPPSTLTWSLPAHFALHVAVRRNNNHLLRSEHCSHMRLLKPRSVKHVVPCCLRLYLFAFFPDHLFAYFVSTGAVRN